MTFYSKRTSLLILVFFFAVLLLAGCESQKTVGNQTTENKTTIYGCKARECGCKYICSYEEPKGCAQCEGEKGLAQVCIVSDGECKNAEDETMARCSLSGGQWKECGSGCGPVLLGQDLFEEKRCIQVCTPQCACPSETPFWSGECVEDAKKGPLVLIQKRNDADSLKFSFRAIVYNYRPSRQDIYCATAEWDYGDGTVDTFSPVCPEYSEESEIQDIFQSSHTFKGRGKHKVAFTLKKGAFSVSENVDVDA